VPDDPVALTQRRCRVRAIRGLILGSVLPVWILWTITLKSSVLPLSGRRFLGYRQSRSTAASTRAPQRGNEVWQLSQVAVSTISRLENAAGRTGRRWGCIGGVVRLYEIADFESHSMRQRRAIDDVRICRDILLKEY